MCVQGSQVSVIEVTKTSLKAVIVMVKGKNELYLFLFTLLYCSWQIQTKDKYNTEKK